MKIKSLKLKNFRNYELLNLEFDGSTNIFYGDNAQGKTNILEAVYLFGTTKSHRGSKDRDMIQFGAEESHIEVIVEKRGIQDQIDMHLKKNRPIIWHCKSRIFFTGRSEHYKKWSGGKKKVHRFRAVTA